jgi:type VI secretion system protein ImpF
MLDRLIDPESGGAGARRGYSVAQLTATLQRDMENLLNSRLAVVHIPAEYVELQQSPLTYGLPDLGSIPTATRQNHQAIAQMIANTIARFEPRLREVRVHLVENSDAMINLMATGHDSASAYRYSRHDVLNLQFQISARLFVDPFPDVAFETVLELTSGHVSVNATRKA